MSVNLLPHNQKAYEEVEKNFEVANMSAVIHPTGTGKSFIVLKLAEQHPDKKILYLSNSRPLMWQLKKNLIKSGLKVNKETQEAITYQKLTSMLKTNTEDFNNLQADYIVLDEFHHCGAPEWGEAIKKLLENNPQAKVLGLSATPMRYLDGEIRDMAEELFDGNIASEMTLEEAITQGILNEPQYTTGLYEYKEIIKELEEEIQKSNDSEKRKIAEEEMAELKELLDSNVKGLPELLEDSMKNKSGKYIVYCKNIEDMKQKMEEAKNMFAKVNSNMEIRSVSSREEDIKQNERTIRAFEKDTDETKLKLLFSVNMLNEGYHLEDLDGVIMMAPTHSPNKYYQQLGRALSVGGKKEPIVIDLVNNIDSIEIIESFSKSMAKTGKEDKTKIERKSKFGISLEIRKVKELVEKISSLVERKQFLSHEEKLELMIEYMRETGEEITADTVYKGCNIGNLRSNLRQQYYNGTLKMDEDLLKAFLEAGILREEKERIRTSEQEKYDFFMSLVGKSKEEIEDSKMSSRFIISSCKAVVASKL